MTDTPSTRQFVACAFRPGDTRSYTYHFDHEPLVKGDRVVVSGKRGPSIVTVVDVGAHLEPSFETRPIVGKERPITTPDSLADGDDRDLEASLGDRP